MKTWRTDPDRPRFASGSPFFLIAGPCVLEDHGLNLEVAREIERVSAALSLPAIFKASFDKANRSSGDSPRGPGIRAGLKQLGELRAAVSLPLLTDVHEAAQCEPAAEVVDYLQIPAFLCRQTDLLLAAGATGLPVNIKKGQWMAPEEMCGAVAKARSAGAAGVALTERGTFFGYGNLVVDMRSFTTLPELCGAPAVFDGTHSVQRPGQGAPVAGHEGGATSGGDPQFVPPLVKAAAAAGAGGLFLEVHPEPRRAPSDASSMLPLAQLEALLREVLAIRAAVGMNPTPAAA